jgi:hypothetical protein
MELLWMLLFGLLCAAVSALLWACSRIAAPRAAVRH